MSNIRNSSDDEIEITLQLTAILGVCWLVGCFVCSCCGWCFAVVVVVVFSCKATFSGFCYITDRCAISEGTAWKTQHIDCKNERIL